MRKPLFKGSPPWKESSCSQEEVIPLDSGDRLGTDGICVPPEYYRPPVVGRILVLYFRRGVPGRPHMYSTPLYSRRGVGALTTTHEDCLFPQERQAPHVT